MALPFIQWKEERFVIEPAAVDYLCSMRGHVAVFFLCGAFRTGRSYLLNALAGLAKHEHAFPVSNTLDRCTKGIWLVVPFKVGATNYVFLDCEGFNSSGKGPLLDAPLCCLGLLLSSMFGIQSVSTIGESDMEMLRLVVECARLIKIANQDPSAIAHSQSLLWIVRDFSLALVTQETQAITATQYLEAALLSGGGNDPDARKHSIRQALCAAFPERECVTLARPLTEEKDLQNLTTLAWSELRPVFRANVEVLRRHLMAHMKPKHLFGTAVTGPAFVRLAQAYVEVVNKGAVPSVRQAWDIITRESGQEAVAAAKRSFTHQLLKFKISDEDELWRHLEQAASSSLQVVREYAVGNVDALIEPLQKELKVEAVAFVEKHRLKSTEEAREAIEVLWLQHGMTKRIAQCVSVDAVVALRKGFEDEFMALPLGIAKKQVCERFMSRKEHAFLERLLEERTKQNCVLAQRSKLISVLTARISAELQHVDQLEQKKLEWEAQTETKITALVKAKWQASYDAKEEDVHQFKIKMANVERREAEATQYKIMAEKEVMALKLEVMELRAKMAERNSKAKEIIKEKYSDVSRMTIRQLKRELEKLGVQWQKEPRPKKQMLVDLLYLHMHEDADKVLIVRDNAEEEEEKTQELKVEENEKEKEERQNVDETSRITTTKKRKTPPSPTSSCIT